MNGAPPLTPSPLKLIDSVLFRCACSACTVLSDNFLPDNFFFFSREKGTSRKSNIGILKKKKKRVKERRRDIFSQRLGI